MPIFKSLRSVPILCTTLILSACGGSSSGPAQITTTRPPPVSTTPTWSAGIFQNEDIFKDKCAVSRSGTNPATGNPFADSTGSTLHENHWLRSWSNRTYLWYNEITDQNPANFTDRLEFFKTLKTETITASGTPKDQFHFTINTAEYQQSVSSGTSADYGARFALISSSVPREVRVAYTQTNSPATSAPANLLRGTKILEIDGVDVVNGGTQADIDVLNAGLFPSSTGETHTFTVLDIGSTTPRTFDMTSAVVLTNPVSVIKTLTMADNTKVGYIHFSTFSISSAEEQMFDAISTLRADNVTELVLDLRYNGGGFLAIASEIGYMIAGPTRTSGKVFDALTFNDKYPNTNPITGRALSPTPFFSTTRGFSLAEGQALPNLNLSRVYILSTARTCSASEAVINSLRGIDVEVILIGTRTCGKPFGFYATDNCGETYFTIQFKGTNDKGFGEYTDGFTPLDAQSAIGELITGCEIGDDFSRPLGDENEDMLGAALGYIENGSCPAPMIAQRSFGTDKRTQNDVTALGQSHRLKVQTFLEQSRIINASDATLDK